MTPGWVRTVSAGPSGGPWSRRGQLVRRYHSLVVVVAGEGTDLRSNEFFAVNTPHSSVNTRSTALNGLGCAFYDFYVLFGAIITEPRCIFGFTVSAPTFSSCDSEHR